MYPAQYIIEKLAISPSSVYNAISHLHAFDMIEKHTEKGNNTIKYYSIKL
jgi:DNA-binding transcriptional regulator GbsR (MarR family)